MKRKKIAVANWKMNLNQPEALKLALAIKDSLLSLSLTEIVICPPALYLSEISKIFSSTAIKIGSQNVYWEKEGAYTGEISAAMLVGIVDYVICGHSERREYFAETNDQVNKKAKAVLAEGLAPIICVGEDIDAWRKGKIDVVLDQVKESVGKMDPEKVEKAVIAYEPVWAIGSGNLATADYANKICLQIRQLLGGIYSRDIAAKMRILYGGSVKGDNAAEFVEQSEIDGLLVGGASLKAEAFIDIVKRINKIK